MGKGERQKYTRQFAGTLKSKLHIPSSGGRSYVWFGRGSRETHECCTTVGVRSVFAFANSEHYTFFFL